jgi:outer membrane protein assembly factor BamD (BamD/ComL family)
LLATNRAKPALAALRSYAREHPHGALRQEATLLRIEALHRAGDRARARALAERFLADNPNSPHAPRVRALGLDAADAR